MTMRRKTLDVWIREAMVDDDKGAKIRQISLVHMVGAQQKEIHTTKFAGGKAWEPSALATMFRSKAEAYAQDLTGSQTFQLLAFYGDRSEPEAFQPFKVTPQSDQEGLGSEPPTEQGLRQQQMRWNDAFLTQVFRRQQTLDEFTMRVVEQQGRAIEVLQRENRDAFTIVKDILMEKALNQHEYRMKELNFERDTSERRKLLTFAPALINTVLGREVFPQSTADTALVESIADALSEEDIMKLASVLKPEMMGPLASRMIAYNEKKELERKALKAASGAAIRDAEADAAGDVMPPMMIARSNGRA